MIKGPTDIRGGPLAGVEVMREKCAAAERRAERAEAAAADASARDAGENPPE